MRRALTAAAAAVALAAAFVVAGGDDYGRYLIRAVFDNAGFVVPGEDVRVAGAIVGSVAEVDVARPGETVSRDLRVNRDGGKAIVVLEVTDPGFQDFRADATCLIRPQSLLGERYVECLPRRPAAPGSPLTSPLAEVPAGDRGAGQLLLPLERNGKAVDIDLVTNIMREPEADRLRLILNELGAGLAARGPELERVILRANPALRELDRTLQILSRERQALAALATDAENAIVPLAREREAVSRFIDAAGHVGEVAAIRRDALEQGIAELPAALRELRRTSGELSAFAPQGTPLARDLGTAAPALASALRRTPGAADATSLALGSLGAEGSAAAPDLVGADPVIRDLGRLARTAAPGAASLAETLASLRGSGGYGHLFDLVYNTSGAFNGYDELGHFLRAELLVTNCVDYLTRPLSGCGANFTGPASATGASASRATSRALFDYLVEPSRPKGEGQ